MTKLFNRIIDKIKRQYLRNNMTASEKHLWKYIRKRRIYGHKFRRQYSICGFVLDFYCPKLKLAIEVDGGIHLKKHIRKYDKERQTFLESFGITFLRFNNNEVNNKATEVLNVILRKTIELSTPSHSPPF